VSYLFDTNVLSELRKGERCHPSVVAWFSSLEPHEIYLSVLTVGELRKGVELIRRRDPRAAESLDVWLQELASSYADRILAVDQEIAERWGRLKVPDPLPVIDSLLAATAIVRSMTLATRNVLDIARTGVRWVNPFTAEESGRP
jgi:toxin FitB